MMRTCWCNTYDFSSDRKRRSTLFHLIAQLELISAAEEACRKRLGDSRLRPDAYQAVNTRISLIDSAVDTLRAVYPSRYGGEPF
jgi:hypothetical protein